MFDYEKVQQVLKDEPDYRLEQVRTAIFKNYISSWEQVSTLPEDLRDVLKEKASLDYTAKFLESADKKTVKARLTLKDGERIETVLMRHAPTRNTVCVSTQVGCSVGCAFCRTGQMGFTRNLTVLEIINQVLLFGQYIKNKNPEERVTNVVFMGMGEPFLNYENVIASVLAFNDADRFNIGARKLSISTVGIPSGIRSLATEPVQVNLAVSLHAPTNNLRNELVPANRTYPIQSVLQAVDDYIEKTNRKVMFEYLLLAGVNDSDDCAKQLSSLLRHRLCMVNLIAYNPAGTEFEAPSPQRVEEFKQILESNGVSVAVRKSYGEDIYAACGQLAG